MKRYLTSFIKNVILLTLISFQVSADIVTSIEGCKLNNINSSKGLHGTIYGLSSGQTDLISSSAFYDGGYSSESQLGTFDNGGAVSFKVNGASTSLYGVAVDSSNFVMESAGYFKADQSGLYEFDLSNVDDGVMLFIGTSVFDCCSSTLTGGSPDSFLWATKPLNSGNTMVYKSWVYMEAGQFYPFKIVFVNAISAGGMSLNVVTPDGTSADIGNYIYQVTNPTAGTCSAVTVSSEFSTSTSWVISGTETQTIQYPATTNQTTYIVEQINYPSNVFTSTMTEVWSGTTTRIQTTTEYEKYYDFTVPAEIVIIDVPALSTVTVNDASTAYTVTTITTVDGSESSVVVIHEPPLSTIYVPTTYTTTSYSTSTGIISNSVTTYTTTDIYAYGPPLPTIFSYPTPFVSGVTTVYTTVNGTTEWVVVENLEMETSTATWDRLEGTQYVTGSVYVSNGETYTTSYWLTKVNEHKTVTSYWTGTTSRHVEYTHIDSVDANGYTWGQIVEENDLPQLSTSFVSGNSERTQTITKATTSYVEIEGNFPTITSFGTNPYIRTSGYTFLSSGTSSGWDYVYVYPSPKIQISEWSGSYTYTSMSTIIANGVTQGYEQYVYVPFYSTSLFFWQGTSYQTITTQMVFTNSLYVVATSTYIIIERPNMPTVTSTWTGTYGTTSYGETQYTGMDGYPVTTSEAFVLIPTPRPLSSRIISISSISSSQLQPKPSSATTSTSSVSSSQLQPKPSSATTSTSSVSSSQPQPKPSSATTSTSSVSSSQPQPKPSSATTSTFSTSLTDLTSPTINSSQLAIFTVFTTETITNTVCSGETITYSTTATVSGTTEIIYDVVVATPPASCNIFYTTEPRDGCQIQTITTNIGTTDLEGKYINATLIIIETPTSCTPITNTLSHISSSKCTQYTSTTVFQTITSCSNNQCHETVVTETSVITDVTTICPESSTDLDITVAPSTTAAPSSTNPGFEETSTVYTSTTVVQTITSCSNNQCHETVVTETSVITDVTTICPESSTDLDITVAPLTTAAPSSTNPGFEETSTVYTSTTVVQTITSCSNNQCHETVVTVTTAYSPDSTPLESMSTVVSTPQTEAASSMLTSLTIAVQAGNQNSVVSDFISQTTVTPQSQTATSGNESDYGLSIYSAGAANNSGFMNCLFLILASLFII